MGCTSRSGFYPWNVPDISIPLGLAGPALKYAIEKARGSELDRLFAALSDELGDSTGLSAVGLGPLRDDPDVLRHIVTLLDDDSVDESALARAIEPHVFQLGEGASAGETARLIVDTIKRQAWRAHKSDREAIVREIRREHRERPAWATARYLSLDWAPRSVQALVADLATTRPGEAQALEDALGDAADQARTLSRLMRSPQPWLAEGSGELWTVVGQLAAAHGLWRDAEAAFVRGAESPGADEPGLLAKAAEMAVARGDQKRHRELLDAARESDDEHPEVLLALARQVDDAAEQLALLRVAEPRTDRQRGVIEAHKALAHLALGDIDEARSSADAALSTAPESPFVREVRPVVTLVAGAVEDVAVAPGWVELCDAAKSFLSLQTELDGLGRHSEAARMLARAAECYTVAGEVGRAAGLLADLATSDLTEIDVEARRHLAKACLGTPRADLARSFLGDDDSTEEARLIRATAVMHTGPGADLAGALADLDKLVSSADPTVCVRAAIARLTAAARLSDVAWSEAAEAALSDLDERAFIATLKAEHLLAAGKTDEAEDLLLDHQDDPRALELLLELAVGAGEWSRAVSLAEMLVARAPTPSARMHHAETLISAGRPQDAAPILVQLRTDREAPTALRARAYGLAAQMAWDRGAFADVASLSEKWLELVPDSTVAAWARVHALIRMSEHKNAVAVVQEHHLVPRDHEEARAVASLFHRALPPNDAVAKIVELADRFDRQDEYLEAMTLLTALGLREPLPPELNARVQSAFDEFPSRFPESQMMRAVPAPETPEEIEAFLKEHAGQSAEHQVDVDRQLARGETAVAVLAAVSNKEVSTTWGRLARLPIGFGDGALDALELSDAADAVGGATVWDPSSLVVGGGLGDPYVTSIVRALPGSVVPNAVLEDVDRAALPPYADSGDEMMFAGWDPREQRGTVTIADAEWVARDRHRAEGALALAKQLRAVPDTSTDRPTKFDELVNQTIDQLPLRTWAAAYSVAAAQGLPLYSDDRYIRAQARREGIATFGTAALLHALADRGRLSTEELVTARRRLRVSGALGIPAKGEELFGELEEAGFRLTESVRQTLLDPACWRPADQSIRQFVELLRLVLERAPELFPEWVARGLDALRFAHPNRNVGLHASLVLASAWASEDAALVQALVRELRNSRLVLGMFDDPVLPAFQLLMSFGDGQADALRAMLFRELIRKVGFGDQLRIVAGVRFA